MGVAANRLQCEVSVREAKRLVRPDPGDGRALAELAARTRTSDEVQDCLSAFR